MPGSRDASAEWRCCGPGRYHVKDAIGSSGASGYISQSGGAPQLLEAVNSSSTCGAGSFALRLEARLSETSRDAAGDCQLLLQLSSASLDSGRRQLVALQIDSGWSSCSLLVLHLSPGGGSGSGGAPRPPPAPPCRLASARLPQCPGRDADDFHTLELSCRRGSTLTVWCDGRLVFSGLDVRRLMGLAQQRSAGPAAASLRHSTSPLTGPLGLGVAGGRLDFRGWRVAPLAPGQAGAEVDRVRAALAAAEAGWGDGGEEGGRGGNGDRARWDAEEEDECAREGGASWGSGERPREAHGYGAWEEEAGEAGGPREVEADLDRDQEADPAWPRAARRAAAQLRAPAHVALAAAASAVTTKWKRRPYIADLDPTLVDTVLREVVTPGPRGGGGAGGRLALADVVVREGARQLLSEAVVMPLILPELFGGALEPWRGVLLFGPPGTGKTMLARAVAASAGVTFFSVPASALTSKWRGDSEKLVRTLFAVAEAEAPSVVFVDEIDGLVGGGGDGGDGDSDASRRFRSELLQQMDGLTSRSGAGRPGARSTGAAGVLVLAASNSPWAIDPALRRRLEKRVYIPLPDAPSRLQLLDKYLEGARVAPDVDLGDLAQRLEGYSGADIKLLCRDAQLAPLRRLTGGHTPAHYRRLRTALGLEGAPGAGAGSGRGRGGGGQSGGKGGGARGALEVCGADLAGALARIRPSVAVEQVARYEEWDRQFAAA